MEWMDVSKRLPSSRDYKMYKVKTIEGSISPKSFERVVLGRMTNTGFRFQTGDWVTVTHWKHTD